VNKLVLQAVVLSAFVGTLAACDMQKKEDQIAATSDRIESQSGHLGARTEDLERELVNKESNTTFADYLDRLFAEGVYSNQVITEPTLLMDAGFAVESMHFQYWKGDFTEDVSVLDDFMNQALELLFVHMTAHIPRTFDPNILCPDRNWKAVGSMGAKIDRMRSEYALNLKNAGLSNLSAYDVIVKALQDRGSFERKEVLPRSTSMVLQWKQDAIYLLQMRQIYLPVTVLARMTNFQDLADSSDWLSCGSRGWDALTGGLNVNLNAKGSNSIDPEELKTWTLWLNQSLQTRQTLKDMCIEPLSNTMINKILAKVNLTGGATSPLTGGSQNVQLQKDFMDAWQKVLAQSTTASKGVDCATFNQ
jgi:hypothetical protein